MTYEQIVVLLVILGSLYFFISEKLSLEIVSLIIISTLCLTKVITPEAAVSGFSNNATITVMFMFVISASLLKTGALQSVGYKFSHYFKSHFNLSLVVLMLAVCFCSAWMNNTPIVALFIPIVMQIAKTSGNSPQKMLIPLSFATIFGGTVTLIGTSTNVLVSGILEKSELEPLHMFDMTPLGIVFAIVGTLYMVFIGNKIVGKKKSTETEEVISKRYLTEIELLDASNSIGLCLMDSPLVKTYDMDVIELKRGEEIISMPSGDLVLRAGDKLKVHCSIEKIKQLKEKLKTENEQKIKVNDESFSSRKTSFVELIITSKSKFDSMSLKDLDFRKAYRAIPLAIRTRDGLVENNLYDTKLQSGDVILAEVKNHYVKNLRQLEQGTDSPFIVLSEENFVDFNKKGFFVTLGILVSMILVASFEIVPIMPASIAAVVLLIITKNINPKEMFESIDWGVIFLLAGTLALGEAMKSSKLAEVLASQLVANFGQYGPYIIVSAVYLFTSILTEIMSNNATAALLIPICISLAQQMGISYVPFVMAITFGASASFMTPIGYQTNAMVYNAGKYNFKDFLKVGTPLNLLFWIIASFLIPYFYPF
jgi:di/tricarboxylate transporter